MLLASGAPSKAATFTWQNVTGNWATGTNWVGGSAPTGLDSTDVLVFGGPVTSLWTATNDVVASPFLLNQISLTATDPLSSQDAHTIVGGPLRFAGNAPLINITSTGSLNINTGVQLAKALTVAGTGTGRVTINGAISGFKDITKTGTGTLRFGSIPPGVGLTAPSMNTWLGRLNIQQGSVLFNNNAQTGSTALRANPITLTTGGTLQLRRTDDDEDAGYETSLRIGTLSGTGGSVIARVVDESAGFTKSASNFDIVITALENGTFAGSVTLDPPVSNDALNPGNDGGKFIVRGTGTQTLTGTLSIHKDVVVGRGATLKLSGLASLGGQTTGALVFAGGDVVLDNSGGDMNRLRNGSAGSTSVETVGGGKLTLVGSLSGSSELTGRLQLGTSSGAENRPRSGALNLAITHTAGTSAATELRFQSYLRKEDVGPQFSTVDFSAKDGVGALKQVGLSGNNPRFFLTNGAFTVPTANNLLSTTAGTASLGWATVNGSSFAAYSGVTGVTEVATQAFPSGVGANTLITGNATAPAGGLALTSIKIAPSSVGQSLDIPGAGNLSSGGWLLAGGIDYVISSTGGVGIGGTTTRFFHVQEAKLTVSAKIAPLANATDNRAIVKAGAGVLELTNTSNGSMVTPVAINAGAVRANHASGALPAGEIQLRGGVLELAGGGTFTRTLGVGIGPSFAALNWSGVTYNILDGTYSAVDDDRGSGGFAAIGSNVIINLTSSLPRISWEDTGFLRSGHGLVLGSKNATAQVTWANDLGLTDANSADINYNARELRVVNNPNSTFDYARITGNISGTLHNDLLKTGDGTLELAHATGNSYQGATIVHEGTLLVNTNNEASFAHVAKTGGILGGNGRMGNVLVEAGGTLSPGSFDSTASILKTKNLLFADTTSRLLVEIGGANAGGDNATGYDRIEVTGSVELGNADLELMSIGTGMLNPGDMLFLILNDGTDAIDGQFADGSTVTLGSQVFSISYTADSGTSSFINGNDVAIVLIPEPGSVLLLGLGAMLTLSRRRHRNV